MPRKKSSRAIEASSEYPAAPRVLKRAAAPASKPSNSNVISLDAARPAAPAVAPAAATTPAASGFEWAWYDASVVCVRTALHLQAALIQQMFLVSPASVAARCLALSTARSN